MSAWWCDNQGLAKIILAVFSTKADEEDLGSCLVTCKIVIVAEASPTINAAVMLQLFMTDGLPNARANAMIASLGLPDVFTIYGSGAHAEGNRIHWSLTAVAGYRDTFVQKQSRCGEVGGYLFGGITCHLSHLLGIEVTEPAFLYTQVVGIRALPTFAIATTAARYRLTV